MHPPKKTLLRKPSFLSAEPRLLVCEGAGAKTHKGALLRRSGYNPLLINGGYPQSRMDRTDKAGHDALTKLFSRFTSSQVDPGWLADQLLTRYIIGADTQDYAGNPYHTKSERLRRVLREVMGNGREGVFQDLVDILLENETYSWLGRELKGMLIEILRITRAVNDG